MLTPVAKVLYIFVQGGSSLHGFSVINKMAAWLFTAFCWLGHKTNKPKHHHPAPSQISPFSYRKKTRLWFSCKFVSTLSFWIYTESKSSNVTAELTASCMFLLLSWSSEQSSALQAQKLNFIISLKSGKSLRQTFSTGVLHLNTEYRKLYERLFLNSPKDGK